MDSSGKGNIMKNIEPIKNKESLFKNSIVLPVYKINYDLNNKPKLVQNKKYFLIFYIGRLYVFVDGYDSRLFENSPIINTIAKFNNEKKDFKIVYFTENFSFDRKYLNPLITNQKLDFIIDKNNKYETVDYINSKYGSLNKLKELAYIDNLREKLKVKDFEEYTKTNYQVYDCKKDTIFILKKLASQIKAAVIDFTPGQELILIEKIQNKLNPLIYKQKLMQEQLKQFNVSDTLISSVKLQDKLEKNNEKQIKPNIEGINEFKVYDISITNELLEVLTSDQFIKYKNYIDLFNPVVETLNQFNNNKYRYGYGKDILEREGIIKLYDSKSYGNYIKNIVKENDCNLD